MLLFRQSKLQPVILWEFGQWMHAWNSAIVIRASHNGLSHRQQHIVEAVLNGDTIAETIQRNLVISFLQNESGWKRTLLSVFPHRAHMKAGQQLPYHPSPD